MREINYGDPYKNDEILKGKYERIVIWFENKEDARACLQEIEQEKHGRFGGNRFFTAKDVIREVEMWEKHVKVLQFGLEGTRNLSDNDLVFETLLILTTGEDAEKVRKVIENPLTWLIQEPDEVNVLGDQIRIWYD